MKAALTLTVAISVGALALPAHAQWLDRPTPGIPRTPDGKPNLAAPAPRAADGHPDLSGPWTGRSVLIGVPDEALTPASKTLKRQREENYFKDRPYFQCQPSGPETVTGLRHIIQTPSVIVIAYDNLVYRLIFTDGRKLEEHPEPSWMGYSVGRWEGETLVVDSVGFNDRTWLDSRGLPHTEALRTSERFVRRNVGQIEVQLTVTDPGAFEKSWTTKYDLALQQDAGVIEAVCEDRTHWIGRVSDLDRDAVAVSADILAKYVGVYSGLWITRPRTVRIVLEDGALYANGLVGEKVRLVPRSETSFSGTDGLSFDFDPAANPAAFMVERHVSGDWKYMRQPQK